jgi:hypothetical protein
MLNSSQRTWLVDLTKLAGGTESAGAQGDQAASGPAGAAATAQGPSQAATPPKMGQPTLEKAPEAWHGTRAVLDTKINALKQAIKNEFAGEGSPALLAEIDQTVAKLDVVLDRLDHKLADSMAKAHAAQDAAARQTELKNSKAILADYINYVSSEPLIAHIDANPLGIETNLQLTLKASLAHMAQAIG